MNQQIASQLELRDSPIVVVLTPLATASVLVHESVHVEQIRTGRSRRIIEQLVNAAGELIDNDSYSSVFIDLKTILLEVPAFSRQARFFTIINRDFVTMVSDFRNKLTNVNLSLYKIKDSYPRRFQLICSVIKEHYEESAIFNLYSDWSACH